jgi:hypothetical protein
MPDKQTRGQINARQYRIACSRHRVAFLNIPERLGGNENSVGCPLIDLAPDGFMKTPSNIWLVAPLMLGNVFPSESIGQIVRLNFPRNPGHRPQHLPCHP